MSKGTFFNTINLTGTDLQRANARALALEALILAIFKANPSKKLSPSQIHTIIQVKYDLHPPLTSVRRGMTNLSTPDKETGNHDLEKTQEKIPGPFTVPEHLWQLSTGNAIREHVFKKGDPSASGTAVGLIKNTFIQKDLFGDD